VRIITLTLMIFILAASSAFAQDFTTEAAKDAKAKYEAALESAREEYKQSLTEAAVKAAEAGDLDEVVRIKNEKDELDGRRLDYALKLIKVQEALEDTKWTWVSSLSGRNPSGLQFLPNQKLSLGGVREGAWQVVEPRTVILRLNSGVWFLYFNNDLTNYTKILNFKPSHHKIKPGKRTSPLPSKELIVD